jgi:hypothetical protein
MPSNDLERELLKLSQGKSNLCTECSLYSLARLSAGKVVVSVLAACQTTKTNSLSFNNFMEPSRTVGQGYKGALPLAKIGINAHTCKALKAGKGFQVLIDPNLAKKHLEACVNGQPER